MAASEMASAHGSMLAATGRSTRTGPGTNGTMLRKIVWIANQTARFNTTPTTAAVIADSAPEPMLADPAFCLDQDAVHHRDLPRRFAEGQRGDAQSCPKGLAERHGLRSCRLGDRIGANVLMAGMVGPPAHQGRDDWAVALRGDRRPPARIERCGHAVGQRGRTLGSGPPTAAGGGPRPRYSASGITPGAPLEVASNNCGSSCAAAPSSKFDTVTPTSRIACAVGRTDRIRSRLTSRSSA